MHAFIVVALCFAAAPKTEAKPVQARAEKAAVPDVVIVPRADWDPSPRVRGIRYAGPLKNIYKTIVVHHSDFVDPPGPIGIKDYHLNVSGFSDIGYHFVIAADGTIYEGRALDRMGAHAGITKESRRDQTKDPDWGSLGIVLDGYFHVTPPPAVQLAALDALLAHLKPRFPKVERVIGHREVRALVEARGLTPVGEPKDCPGDALFGHLAAARK